MEENDVTPEQSENAPAEPPPRVDPPESRFLFVDIAAMRAKQLRRGAVPRVPRGSAEGTQRDVPHKLERVAMEEVRQGIISYDVPQPAAAGRAIGKES
jgi:DNA-directed RNA polymerase subunit K/omega